MKLYRLNRIQFLPISVKTAWDFFSNPHNLHQITPAWLDFKLINAIPEKMHAGMIIHYRLKPLFGMPTHWISEITHVNQPVFFVDEMRLGPFRFWHHQHRFIEKTGGIEIQDTVNYALKYGWLGQIPHDMLIGPRLIEIFDYRKTSLEQIFKSQSNSR